ncbi:MAG: phosphomannomutase/phosphoglucomutase [Pseudomonadota bacterium]|nr:phosphomannomutase/phosphoglucomutase [Pseudomonadota bacterium]
MRGGSAHYFDETILREYDVRGIVGDTLSVADAYAIGRAFATVISDEGGTAVCVGYDGRLSSPEMEQSLVKGLNDSGVDVARIGIGPTPMLYFAVKVLGAAGGIMVSGSHNPPEYNGFKIMRETTPFYGEDIQNLKTISATANYVSGSGSDYTVPVFDRYVKRIAQDFRSGRTLKVAWDAGNGAAGDAMVRLAQILPGEHILLNEKIDGTFPAHHPDPTVAENLSQLRDVVLKSGCDLGIAFDGDGDRIGVIDNDGEILWGDQLMVIWAKDVLVGNPGATIIADVKASQILFDQITSMGGNPIMWRTGHSLIKAKMMETGALLAGEMSGHIFFADKYFGYDDALYAAVRLLSCLTQCTETLSGLRKRLPHVVNTPELRFACPEERKFEIVDEVSARLSAVGAEVVEIDGVRVKTDDGWWLLRSSNTQNAVVARCEGTTLEGLTRLKEALVKQVRASGLEPPIF